MEKEIENRQSNQQVSENLSEPKYNLKEFLILNDVEWWSHWFCREGSV